MRFSASSAANAIAWAVVMLLIVAGLWLANRLGFIGLLLLGGMTCLVCIMAELDRNAPIWGTEVFKARRWTGGTLPSRKPQHWKKTGCFYPRSGSTAGAVCFSCLLELWGLLCRSGPLVLVIHDGLTPGPD